MTEAQYVKRKIQQLRAKCTKHIELTNGHNVCNERCRVVEATPKEETEKLKLTFNCWIHGHFTKVKTLKSLLK